MGLEKDKLSKIPYSVLKFNKDGEVVNEESYNLENIYLDPYRVEAIALSILPDIQAYFQTEEGQAEFEKWRTEQAAFSKCEVIELEPILAEHMVQDETAPTMYM